MTRQRSPQQQFFTFYFPSGLYQVQKSPNPAQHAISRYRGTVIRTETTPAWSTSGLEGTRCTLSQEPVLPPFSQEDRIA